MASYRLGFTGDVMLGRLVDDRQRRRRVDAVWGDLLDRLDGLDGLCINLECCLSDRGTKWTRTDRPFHFRADPEWAVEALESVGVDFACLANNHVLDFNAPALLDTLDHLEEAGIAHAGAGRTVEGARQPARFEVGAMDVAVIAFTDNTPEYAAGPDTPGTAHIEIDVSNPETRAAVTDAIDRARSFDPDLLVASLHWGPNMRTEPPADFREFGRWLIERGIDVLHGHSAHVFQGIERHDDGVILYDTGDFVDDYAVDRELRNDRGFLFELEVTEAGVPTRLRLVPIEIRDCAVHRAGSEVAAWCRESVRDRSARFETTFEREGEGLVISLAD